MSDDARELLPVPTPRGYLETAVVLLNAGKTVTIYPESPMHDTYRDALAAEATPQPDIDHAVLAASPDARAREGDA